MTPSQREQLNRFLAENVLSGIERDGIIMIKHGGVWFAPDFSILADCEPLLNKIEQDGWIWETGFRTWNDERWYWFDMEKGSPYRSISRASNQPSSTQAISLAIARAYGWKEAV